MLSPLISFDYHQNARLCGIDEAGRGSWAGVVMAACVMWKDWHAIPSGLNDSKKLSAAKREALYDSIIAAAYVGIGEASAAEIDQFNILRATLLAMQRAYAAMGKSAELALIDGNHAPLLPCPARCVIQGDGLSASIAAASIIAKVTRDRRMSALATNYPQYGFEAHAGYGTAQHQKALATHGACPEHRRSFAPIRALIQSEPA